MIVDELWGLALSDAGIAPHEALRFDLPGKQLPSGNCAVSWPRNLKITDRHECAAIGSKLVEANSAEGRSQHRVGICLGQLRLEVVAARLRHELEHCLQFEHDRYLFEMFGRAEDEIGKGAEAMPGLLYNRIPMEADANAAASLFVRSLFGDERIDTLLDGGEDPALLRCGSGPQPKETLEKRMRLFIGDAYRQGEEWRHAQSPWRWFTRSPRRCWTEEPDSPSPGAPERRLPVSQAGSTLR